MICDASCAVQLWLPERNSVEISEMFAAYTMAAPELVVAEILNAGWKAWRSGAISSEDYDQIAAGAANAFDSLVPMSPLATDAARIAMALNHPIYDCFYLALADAESDRLMTADRRLAQKLVGTPWADRLIVIA